MRAPLAALLIAVLAAPAAPMEAPRSAIPWLSDVLEEDPAALTELPPFGMGEGRRNAVTPFPTDDIITSSLDDPVRDGFGILPPERTGFPAALWGNTSALRVRSLISGRMPQGVPSARALYRAVLLAETEPPPGAYGRNEILLARIDALMAAGLLDEADALISRAGITDAETFRRAFDLGLLTGRADAVCRRLRSSPALSPTLPARVFCLARADDWNAAALTLSLGLEIGEISEAEEAILARFLDPELFEGVDEPPAPEPLTTLEYVLREAVGLPRPPGPLPLAFLRLDTGDDAPVRARIEAGERLVRAGAMPPRALFAAYRDGKPAASGGVWDRMAAVQSLDFAFATADPAATETALATADRLFSETALRHALAAVYARQIRALEAETFDSGSRRRVAELLLLAGETDAAVPWTTADGTAADRLLTRLAEGQGDFPDAEALPALEAAVARGLTRDTPPAEDAARISARFDQGYFGEALIHTLDLLGPGSEVDPGDLAAGLYLLRYAGLEEAARMVAIETLLLLPEA